MRKIISLFLLISMLIGTVNVFSINISAEESTNKVELTQGEIIELGNYPQTKVTDEDIISNLNSIDAEWISYNYYISSVASDYMKYKDVEYSGEKYRAVTFTSYRPSLTSNSSSTSYSEQNDNGYNTNTVYWFKYEPIKWKVLDPDKGLVICESIMDSQEFYNSVYTDTGARDGEECYANSYKHSNIRKFLTDTFYNQAFNSLEKELIVPATISSNDYTTDNSTGNGNVTDSVFLLSYKEMLNTNYGFSSSQVNDDTARRKQGTDYAKSQGLYVYSTTDSSKTQYNGNSIWWLRSAGSSDDLVCRVDHYGCVSNYGVRSIYIGVCPALYLNVNSAILNCVQGNHTLGEGIITKAATCKETGIKLYTCEVCGYETTEEIPSLGGEHSFENNCCTKCGYY